MVFSSLLFLFVYLPITMLLYFISPLKLRNAVLLVFNFIFYAWGEPFYVIVMVVTILVDYVYGILIEKYRQNDKLARSLVAQAVVINLGLLVFFKYYDFIITSLKAVFPGLPLAPLGIALPIGISFYTFQTMSYVIDVYRKDAGVQRNLVSFGTFVTLFPQLIAGPIVKYKDVDDQLTGRRENVEQFASGVRTFVCGLCKKVLLANSIGALWDSMRALPVGEMSALGAWLGVLAFTFQIYFDFSGYSDMAIGLGRMFGFEFLPNFNYPYISRSVTEFWRRWHMSLGGWFRDYVYIPLGGNRGGTAKTFRNILVVWALTGIWHGASWNFLLWGLFYAVFLMLEKAFLLDWLKKSRVVSHIYAMLLVMGGWVIFAVEDVSQIGPYFAAMFGAGGAASGVALYHLRAYLPMLIILILASTPLPKKLYDKACATRYGAWVTPVLCVLGLVLSTAYLVNASYNPFLYFRF